MIFICFSNAFPKEEYVNLGCSIILFWSDGNISSPVRCSYLSILADDNADIFSTSLLILHYSFKFLILSSVVMISFYILNKTFFMKREDLPDARVVSITKKEFGFVVQFL